MNKNKFHLGGHLPSWYDTDFLQNSMIEVIKGVMASLGLDEATSANYPFILSGCVVAGTAIGEGFIYWNGEVYYHPLQSTISGSGNMYMRLKETWDAVDPIPYATGGNQNVHAIRRVEFYKASTPTGSSDMDFSLLTPIAYTVITKLGLDNRFFQSLTNYINVSNFSSNWSSSGSPALRYKIFDDRLIMSGRAVAGASAAGTIFTINGLLISQPRYIPVVLSSTTTDVKSVLVENNGTGGIVFSRLWNTTINDIVDFSCVDFLL
jgi:hypothetical protein